MNPVRDGTATTARGSAAAPPGAPSDARRTVGAGTATRCPACGKSFQRLGRQRFCSTGCRQSAWRTGRAAPVEPVVAKSGTVYSCPACTARYMGEQRCDACNLWCRRLGPGAPCPCCDEPISITDLLGPEQFAKNAATKPTRRR